LKFADNLKSIRKFLGVTQAELGNTCGLSAQHIAQYEAGNREPTLPNLKKMKKGLGCSYEKLIEG